MDLLKRELQRKRQSLDADFGGKKLLKRSEIEQKKIQKLREEEQRELQSKSLRPQSSATATTTAATASSPSNPSSLSSLPPALASSSAAKNPAEKLSNENKIDDLVLTRQEVVRRLRILKQPITLFGEDDDARLDRLKLTLKTGVLEIDDEMTQGQTNDFLRDIYELRKRQKAGGSSSSFLHEKGKHKRGEDADGMEDDRVNGDGDKDLSGDGGSSGMDSDMDMTRMKANFEELCDEDKILVFFKKLLNEWNQELKEMSDTEKRTAKGKSMVATYKQCARYLNPLFKFCRKKVLQDDIRRALMVVVRCCMKRDYLAAMDQYIKLAIGNAPWPIGVTMVGIHERSAREKIYTNSVAHIMNDETTRKYLQSVKRLMTLCQRRYPALPSKSVEFNSLANGSDLQSLLAEEGEGGDAPGEGRLRLMAAPEEW